MVFQKLKDVFNSNSSEDKQSSLSAEFPEDYKRTDSTKKLATIVQDDPLDIFESDNPDQENDNTSK